MSVSIFVMVSCISVNRFVGRELYAATAGVRALTKVLTSGTDLTLELTLLSEACSVCKNEMSRQAATHITATWTHPIRFGA